MLAMVPQPGGDAGHPLLSAHAVGRRPALRLSAAVERRHFGAAEHPGWLPGPVAEWLALPPRPPLVSERDGRCLTVCLLPGDPYALLLRRRERASAQTRSTASA
jgi:hypothetical protein